MVSIKNARFKCQPSIRRATLCIKRYTPFLEIDYKWREISTKILREVGFGHRYGQRGKLDLDMDMDKEGAILRMEKDQNSWTREAHK